eukprot:10214977-Alexandrium_andersonii.AAC.1
MGVRGTEHAGTPAKATAWHKAEVEPQAAMPVGPPRGRVATTRPEGSQGRDKAGRRGVATARRCKA